MAEKIFIDGQAGTTGLRIHERLADRNDLTMITLTEETRKDPEARRAAILESDVTFLCLPDDAAREAVALAGDADVRIIDASTAHRTNPDWAYGIPELSPEHREKIRHSKRVAVPGCYASGFASLVYPMVHSGLLPKDYPVQCFAMSGYSGGGKKMIAEIESPDRAPELYSPRFYGLANNHKHLPEMQKISGLAHTPMFVPVVCDYYCGMQVLVPLDLTVAGTTAEAVAAGLADYYKDAATVKVHALNEPLPENGLYSNAMAGTDRMELYLTVNAAGDQMMLVSLFDNLGKGSSGAAVQCMNLMLGLPETQGLE